MISQKVCGKRKDVQKKKSIDKSCKCNKRNAAEKHVSSENIHFDIAGRTFSQQTVASNKMKLLNLSWQRSLQPSNFSIFCRQIKCRGNYMNIHFASAFPRQCFCRDWQDFILRTSVFTSATLAKISTRSKLVKLFTLLHISPRIRSIMCTVIVVQILLYKYCYMQSNVLFSHVKNCFKNNFGCFVWVQK